LKDVEHIAKKPPKSLSSVEHGKVSKMGRSVKADFNYGRYLSAIGRPDYSLAFNQCWWALDFVWLTFIYGEKVNVYINPV
jgi:hypothetical protein